MRLWERIRFHETLEEDLTRICETFGEVSQVFARL